MIPIKDKVNFISEVWIQNFPFLRLVALRRLKNPVCHAINLWLGREMESCLSQSQNQSVVSVSVESINFYIVLNSICLHLYALYLMIKEITMEFKWYEYNILILDRTTT